MAYSLVDSELRINLNQQMYMVWHDFHFKDFGVNLGDGLLNQLLQPLSDFSNEALAPIFRTPDNMVFARENDVLV